MPKKPLLPPPCTSTDLSEATIFLRRTEKYLKKYAPEMQNWILDSLEKSRPEPEDNGDKVPE